MDSEDILWKCLIDKLKFEKRINYEEFSAIKTTIENNNKRVDAFEDLVNGFQALVDNSNKHTIDDIFKGIECCSMLNTLKLQTQIANKLLLSKEVSNDRY